MGKPGWTDRTDRARGLTELQGHVTVTCPDTAAILFAFRYVKVMTYLRLSVFVRRRSPPKIDELLFFTAYEMFIPLLVKFRCPDTAVFHSCVTLAIGNTITADPDVTSFTLSGMIQLTDHVPLSDAYGKQRYGAQTCLL